MAQILGIIECIWGGVALNIKPGGTFKIGGLVNTAVVFGTQVGRAQKMMESEIAVKVVIEAGDRITDVFGASLEQELQIRCDTGQTFVWESAFRKDILSVTSGDNSEVDVNFAAGAPMEL
jgi:hypothetical protein